MLYIVDCRDKPGHGQVRLDNRAAHLTWLAGLGNRVFAAGPTLDDDGTTMTGSLLIIAFADRAEAATLLAADPYAHAGPFASVTVRPWRKVLPADPPPAS